MKEDLIPVSEKLKIALLKSIDKENFEQFKQRIEEIPDKNSKSILLNPLSLETDRDYTLLVKLLINEFATKDYARKLEFILNKLSKIKDFDLVEHLNSYRVQHEMGYKGSSLYFLACFTAGLSQM